MNNKPCFICVYYGAFPNYFEYWLQCCKHNPDFYWFIITEDKPQYQFPPNVIVKEISFIELRRKIEFFLGFPINLEEAYKLCDVRPLYADIFKEELKEFSHWGYMDFDLIFGKLHHFFSDEILDEYDKVSALGHAALIRNTPDIATLYKQCDYKGILQSKHNRTFDELRFSPNINELIVSNGYSLKPTISYADIGASHYNFYTFTYFKGRKTSQDRYYPTIFSYLGGKTYKHSVVEDECITDEVAYIHFSRRKIKIPETKEKDFIFVPNEFLPYSNITEDIIKNYSKDNIRYYMNQIIKKYKKKIISII